MIYFSYFVLLCTFILIIIDICVAQLLHITLIHIACFLGLVWVVRAQKQIDKEIKNIFKH